MATMVVNAVLAVGLAFWVGFLAAAIATSFAAWVMVWLLWRGSRTMGMAARLDEGIRRRAWRIVLASAIMGLAIWVILQAAAPIFLMAQLRIMALVLLVLAAMVIYFGAAFALGALNVAQLKASLKRSA